MNITDLADDLLKLVGEAVAAKHATSFVTSLPFNDSELRMMRCIVHRGKMTVVYAKVPLSRRVRDHLAYICKILGSESDATNKAVQYRQMSSRRHMCSWLEHFGPGTDHALAGGLQAYFHRMSPMLYDGVNLSRWTNVYIGHETHLYSVKAVVEMKGSLRVPGFVAVMARGDKQDEQAHQPINDMTFLDDPTDGQSDEGSTFRLNGELFRRVRVGRRLTWIRVGE